MALFSVPPQYRPGLATLLKLDDESVGDLAAALSETRPTLSTVALASSLASLFPRLPPADLEQLLASLDSLHVLRASRELSAGEVAEQIGDAIEQHRAGTLRLDGTSRPDFERRLRILLEVPTLAVQAKASAVFTDHQQIFQDALILSDLRPIFGDDPTELPVGLQVVHTLKIEYLRSHQYLEEFFVALDNADLVKLAKVVARAQSKAHSLAALISSTGVPELDE